MEMRKKESRGKVGHYIPISALPTERIRGSRSERAGGGELADQEQVPRKEFLKKKAGRERKKGCI